MANMCRNGQMERNIWSFLVRGDIQPLQNWTSMIVLEQHFEDSVTTVKIEKKGKKIRTPKMLLMLYSLCLILNGISLDRQHLS